MDGVNKERKREKKSSNERSLWNVFSDFGACIEQLI